MSHFHYLEQGLSLLSESKESLLALHYLKVTSITFSYFWVSGLVRKNLVTASTVKVESYKRIIPINVPLNVQLTCVDFALNN